MDTMKEPLFPLPDGPVRMDLKPERVQQMLERLPGWALHSSGRAIVRVRMFTTERKAGSFVRKACWLATKLLQPVMVSLAGKEVTIALTGHPVRGCTGGLTNTVFNLADLIG
jgi:pterin-4a-carbinolamine dehydratase